jgi:serine/threonine-protein kinase RsbW
MSAAPLSDRLAISNQFECIDEARRWVAAHARNSNLEADHVFDLELAITEALSNVIRHAYGGEGAQPIELSLAIDERRVELSLLDRGRPFLPRDYRPPDLDEPGEGNYGLHLIDQLVDEVHRRSRPGEGTVLSLVKYRNVNEGEARV